MRGRLSLDCRDSGALALIYISRNCVLKMEGNEQVSVPKLKIIACKHPDATDAKGPKAGNSGTPAKDKDKEKDA